MNIKQGRYELRLQGGGCLNWSDEGSSHVSGSHLPEQTAVAERNMLAVLLTDLEAIFGRTSRLLSPYDTHMASFHIQLLRQELLKRDDNEGKPSADIIMMAGTWLLARVPGLVPPLVRLLLSTVTFKVLVRAGGRAVQWAEARAAEYEAEGRLVNLTQLTCELAHTFNERALRRLCLDMDITYEMLYGWSDPVKARELVGYCVRHGRVRELQGRYQEMVPGKGGR